MSLELRIQHRVGPLTLALELALPGQGVTAITGPSGCGKTTLLRCVAGLLRPEQGRIVVSGSVWQDGKAWVPVHRRGVGYVAQHAGLFAHLSVAANLDYGWRRSENPASAAQRARLLEVLGIEALLPRLPAHLSGGERQRVAIARALLAGPRLLLLDEPMAALDAGRKSELLPYLDAMGQALQIPVLYVSHAADEIARLADHLVVMAQGHVVAAGPLSETLAQFDATQGAEDAGVVLKATVVERDADWHLARVTFDGGSLWVRDEGQSVGASVRVRIQARDVSLALGPAQQSSVLNSVPALVEALQPDDHPAQQRVRLRIGPSPVLARITQRSSTALGLAPGHAVWLHIKAVAVLR